MTTSLDPRLPVLVGVGQLSQRVDRGEPALEPADLMAEALRRAEADTGASGVLQAADSVRVLHEISWPYGDPGALVAQRLRASPRETGLSVMGGNYVQTLVNLSAAQIQAGQLDLVLLTGAEAWRSRNLARKSGTELRWTTQPNGTKPSITFGTDDSLSHPAEIARSIVLPVQIYPMFEIALRAAEGLDADTHLRVVSQLWSRFSEVAATNPYAWIQRTFTAEEIATPSPDNRMIGYPYTKLMNSNNNVEQGAGLILCSVEKATALGISRDRWIFPHAGADAHDHWFVSERADLHSSPAMRIAGRAALDLAGIGADDLAHIDLYSCFPSAVQIAARELGVGLDRQLTVTGGMSFAGGPWNNYTMHAVATMAGMLRDDPGSRGLCTGNGGYLTKHAFGVYSTEPPPAGQFRHAEPQDEVDELPRRSVAEEVEGAVTVEAYTVIFDRSGEAETGLAAVLTPDGRRAWASTADGDTMSAMVKDDVVGRSALLDPDGTLRLT